MTLAATALSPLVGTIPVTLRNSSHRGFCAESAAVVPIGSFITVSGPALDPIHAQVRWALGGRFGAAYTLGTEAADD